jgi:hypothetical protein
MFCECARSVTTFSLLRGAWRVWRRPGLASFPALAQLSLDCLNSWSDPDTTQQGVTLDGADGSVRGSGDPVEAAKGASVGPEDVASVSDAVGSSRDEQSTGTAEGERTAADAVRTLGAVAHAASKQARY